MCSFTGFLTTAGLNAKATEIENKKYDTKSFLTTQEFKRLAEISFDAAKISASKSKVDNALDKADKNREKIKKTSDV